MRIYVYQYCRGYEGNNMRLYKKMQVSPAEMQALREKAKTSFIAYDILKRIEIERGVKIGKYKLY